MEIKIKQIPLSETKMGRTEIDYNFLGTNYARKVYVVKKGYNIMLPKYPHEHKIGHTLILIEGSARLAYKESTGKIKIIKMEIGKQYFVPPDTPHHLEIRGGIVESYYPTHSYFTTNEKIKTFKENFFKKGEIK